MKSGEGTTFMGGSKLHKHLDDSKIKSRLHCLILFKISKCLKISNFHCLDCVGIGIGALNYWYIARAKDS